MTRIVFVRLPRAAASNCFGLTVLAPTLLLAPITQAGTRPVKILGTKQIIILKKFPLYPANSENGVNKNALGLAGIIKVHTIKLKMAIINPISIPIFFPKVKDAMITGIMARVATIGPIGIEPSGVKQKITSITTKKHTLSVNFKFFILIILHQGHCHL